MIERKRLALMERWGVLAFLCFAFFWIAWRLAIGEVPAVTTIRWDEGHAFAMPFGISRWLDVLFAPVWSTLIIYLGTAIYVMDQLVGTDHRTIRQLTFIGLASGLGWGVVSQLGTGLAPGLYGGLIVGLLAGLWGGYMGAVISGLGFGFGFGLVTMGLGPGLILGLATWLLGAFIAALGWGVVAILSTENWAKFAHWAMARDINGA